MRCCLDENLSPESARLARRDGLDVVSSHEVGMNGRSDAEQLRFAAAQGRCLVTRDYGDFEDAARVLAAERLDRAGILLAPRSIKTQDFASVARAIGRWEDTHTAGLPPNFVGYL